MADKILVLPGPARLDLTSMHNVAGEFDPSSHAEVRAIHSVWLPLKESEVRQSLGFLSIADREPARFPARSAPGTPTLTSAAV